MPQAKKLINKQMDQVPIILASLVLLTLTFAIARQLSEQHFIYQFPDSFGTPYSRHGWDEGELQN